MIVNKNTNLVRTLHFKIALFVIVTILIIFGFYSGYQFYLYQEKLTTAEMESSELLGYALASSIEIAMLNNDINAIQYSIEEISKNLNIERVFLINLSNKVRASSDKETIGTVKSIDDEGCRECHKLTTDGSLPASVSMPKNDILRVVVPIKNKPSCYGCHGTKDQLNGLLVLDRSQQPTRAELYSSIKRAGFVAGISILVMMFLFRWYIKRQIINRVAYLESLARRVVDNELDLDIELTGKDELASLARSFNNMKSTLRLSIDKIENHRNYLNNLLNNLLDGILIVDDNDQIVFVNKSLWEVLEIDSFSIKSGDRVNLFLHLSSQFAPFEKLIEQARVQKKSVKDVIRLQFPADREKHLEVHTGYLILPPRRRPEVIIVVRDITAIITFEKQMYQSEKLATVGRLAAGIAHEINNPMASILTCAEGLLKNNQNNDNNTKEYLEIITNSAHRCKMITQKLLDYSTVSDLRMETVNPEEILKEAVLLLQFEASKKAVALTINKNGPIPLITGSKDSLVQVFINLILNSIQAVDVGGKVDIDIKTNHNSVDFFVKDDGAGISEENLGQVFEPFFTTKPIGTGTGLGLSVSQGIIKKHKGKITLLESRKGSTSINVSLPLTLKERKVDNES